MSSDSPNVVVNVEFEPSTKQFSFDATHTSRGWEVTSDGNIYPAVPGRVIQFQSASDNEPEIRFAGFQISATALDPEALPSVRWSALPAGVTALSPAPYPGETEETTFTGLTFDFGVNSWYYRLAVVTSDGLSWHDPKIHDDGSQ